MTEERTCPACGAPGRYVRHPEGEVPMAWCAEHAPAATSPWVTIAQLVAVLAILGVIGFKVWRRFLG